MSFQLKKIHNAYFNVTKSNAFEVDEDLAHNPGLADGRRSEGDGDEHDEFEDCLTVSLYIEEELVHATKPDEPTWVLPGAIGYSFNKWVIYAVSAPVRINLLQKGETFREKNNMKAAIGNYALDRKFIFKIISFNNVQFEVKSSDQTCSFSLCSRRDKTLHYGT